jgi:hypothetical protein
VTTARTLTESLSEVGSEQMDSNRPCLSFLRLVIVWCVIYQLETGFFIDVGLSSQHLGKNTSSNRESDPRGSGAVSMRVVVIRNEADARRQIGHVLSKIGYTS